MKTLTGTLDMDILIFAIGAVCAGIFLYTFLTVDSHSTQPARVLPKLIATDKPEPRLQAIVRRQGHRSIE